MDEGKSGARMDTDRTRVTVSRDIIRTNKVAAYKYTNTNTNTQS